MAPVAGGYSQTGAPAPGDFSHSEMSNMMDMESGFSQPPQGAYYCPKDKTQLGLIDRQLANYNALAPAKKGSLNMMCTLGFAGYQVLVWLFCREMETFAIWFALGLSSFAILFSFWLTAWVLKFDDGIVEMRSVADSIREGAEGYFATQYGMILKISVVTSIGIFFLYFNRETASVGGHGSSVEEKFGQHIFRVLTLALWAGALAKQIL